ncbi:hypothetical protein, partial [Nocardia gamkensis]
MSTPVSNEPTGDETRTADETSTTSAETSTTSTAAPRRRGRGPGRKKSADSTQAEAVGDENVVFLNEADRLNQIQGRIRTKKGHWLRSLTDLGNSERYLDIYSGDLLFVDESNRWRGYNGKHWRDETGDRELHTRVKRIVRDIWGEAQHCTPFFAEEVRKWARESEAKGSINAIKSLLVSECVVSVEDFDSGAEADTLNLINGTLNLETFELQPHAKEDMLAKFTPVTYDPEATAPNWEAHLAWAIPDPDTRETVQ